MSSEPSRGGSQPAFRDEPASKKKSSGWLPVVTWGVAILMIALMVYVLFRRTPIASFASAQVPTPTVAIPTAAPIAQAALPEYNPEGSIVSVARLASLHTIIPDRPRENALEYTVEKGDSVFSIAKDYNLKPESVLWANYDVLKDDPQSLAVGQVLRIPPTDGVYYKWKNNDTIQGVADKYKVTAKDILTWPGNRIDLVKPEVKPDTFVMIPNGKGEFRQWVVPTIPRGPAGVSLGINGCDTSKSNAYGTGGFVWPGPVHQLSGNDYWSGHLGIDIAAGLGQYVYASDSGVVVYAAPIGGGYGNMVMIDHGNGYQTLYAHLSQINVKCGTGVTQGQVIALAGSTGNSTGPHLHFEVRYMGGFVNPWSVLP